MVETKATEQADRLQEKIAGVCLIVGGLLLAPTTYFEYTQGTLFLAGSLGLLLYALLIPGLLGIARSLRPLAPRLSVIANLLVPSGCLGGASFETALLHEWAARTAGTPEAMMTAIINTTEERVFPILVILGILFPISLLTLSIGLFRTGVAPLWVATLLGIGALLFPVGHIGSLEIVSHVAETLLLVTMIWFGVRSFTGTASRGIVIPATA